MNDNKVTVSKYAWVAMVAVFVLVFGGVWIASSPRESPRSNDNQVARTDAPTYEAFDRTYASRIPAEPPMPAAPVFNPAPAAAIPPVVVTPMAPQAAKPSPAPQAKPKPKEITPRDMFPVGDITRDLPRVSHPYRQIAELYPSFEYRGKLWSSTGHFVLSSQAQLVPTGLKLATGQYLFALADASASEGILFVQSGLNPDKYAVYRAT